METLKQAIKTYDPAGELAQKSAKLYVVDGRFKAYYDQEQEVITDILRNSILIYIDLKS